MLSDIYDAKNVRMKSMKSKVTNMAILALTAILAVSLLIPIVDCEESSATITVTDSDGKMISLDEPAGKVVTLGLGYTITVIDLGFKEKIIGYDSGSTYASSGNKKVEGMEVENLGSAYANPTNIENIRAHMAQMVDDLRFDKDKDLIIINNWSGTVNSGGTRDVLVGDGYKVACFGANTYDEIVSMISSISQLLGGDSNNVVERMTQAKTEVQDMAASKSGEVAPKAMYVSEFNGNLRIYNSGITVSMIELAGGVNIGDNGEAYAYRNEDASYIIQKEPNVVFLDGNYSETAEYFQEEVLNTRSIKVVKLEKDWNSTTPQVADGLLTISESLYNSPVSDEDWIGNNAILIFVGGIAAVIAVGLALFLIRRH